MQKLINTLLTLVIGLTPIISYAATDQGIMGAPAVATQKEMAPDETNEPKAKDMKMKEEDHAAALKKAQAKYDAALKKARDAYAKALIAKKDKKAAQAALKKAEVAAKKMYTADKNSAMKAKTKPPQKPEEKTNAAAKNNTAPMMKK